MPRKFPSTRYIWVLAAYISLVSEQLINQLLFCYHTEEEEFGVLLLEIEVDFNLMILMYHRV